MMRMREHIYRLHASHPIIDIEQRQIPRLGSRIATHIHDTSGSSKKQSLDDIVVHAGTRRIGNNYIGATVLFVSPA